VHLRVRAHLHLHVQLITAHSKDSSRQPPYYTSTKSLAIDASPASHNLPLFNNINTSLPQASLAPQQPQQQPHISRLHNGTAWCNHP